MSSENEDTKRSKLPPGQVPIKRLLRWGVDHPGITRSNPKIDLKTYTLTIDGEVEKPVQLRWDDLKDFPTTESTSDFHCVEGWSVLGCRWRGITVKQVVDLVKPKENAAFATIECADGYTTSLSLEELLQEGILLAYELDGKPLEPGYGFPLRLVVPTKYGYKSALWVTRIRLTSSKEMGFWEKRGYSDTADVWRNDRFSMR